MDTGHDLAPDILVEGGSAVSRSQFLVIVTAGPDAGSEVRGVAHKPDIVVLGSRSALSGT